MQWSIKIDHNKFELFVVEFNILVYSQMNVGVNQRLNIFFRTLVSLYINI